MKRVFSCFFILALLGFVPIWFSGCDPCKCGNPGPDKYLSLDSVERKTSCYGQQSESFDSARFYGFDSIWQTVFPTKQTLLSAVLERHYWFSLTNIAFACDCVGPTFILKDNITKIEIVADSSTIYTSNEIFNKGDEINSLFNGGTENYISDVLLNDYIKRGGIPSYGSVLKIRLRHKPDSPVVLNFHMKVTLSNGKEFLFENVVMKVQ